MRSGVGAILAGALAISGCSGGLYAGPLRHHGDFTLVASRELAGFGDIGAQQRVTVRGCWRPGATLAHLRDDLIAQLVDQAIGQRSDANALALVEIQDEGQCVVVSGWPVRYRPPDPRSPARP